MKSLNQGPDSAVMLLNEIHVRGSLNETFNFNSGMNLYDVKSYENFYSQNYLGNQKIKQCKNYFYIKNI